VFLFLVGPNISSNFEVCRPKRLPRARFLYSYRKSHNRVGLLCPVLRCEGVSHERGYLLPPAVVRRPLTDAHAPGVTVTRHEGNVKLCGAGQGRSIVSPPGGYTFSQLGGRRSLLFRRSPRRAFKPSTRGTLNRRRNRPRVPCVARRSGMQRWRSFLGSDSRLSSGGGPEGDPQPADPEPEDLVEPEDNCDETESRGAQDREPDERGLKPPSLHARIHDHSARTLGSMDDDECAAAGGDGMPESGPASHSLVGGMGESGGSPGPWAAEGKQKGVEEKLAADSGADKAERSLAQAFNRR